MTVPGVRGQPAHLRARPGAGATRAIRGQTSRLARQLRQRPRRLIAGEDRKAGAQRGAPVRIAPDIHVGAIGTDGRALALGQTPRLRAGTSSILAAAVKRKTPGGPGKLRQRPQRLRRPCRPRAKRHTGQRENDRPTDTPPSTPTNHHQTPPVQSAHRAPVRRARRERTALDAETQDIATPRSRPQRKRATPQSTPPEPPPQRPTPRRTRTARRSHRQTAQPRSPKRVFTGANAHTSPAGLLRVDKSSSGSLFGRRGERVLSPSRTARS